MYYSGCTGAYNQDRYGYGERYALNTGLTGASSNPHCTCYCPHSSSHFCNHDKVDCCAGALYDGSLLTVPRIHQRANVCQPLCAISALSLLGKYPSRRGEGGEGWLGGPLWSPAGDPRPSKVSWRKAFSSYNSYACTSSDHCKRWDTRLGIPTPLFMGKEAWYIT